MGFTDQLAKALGPLGKMEQQTAYSNSVSVIEKSELPTTPATADVPIVVDLDGTLAKSDLLIESMLMLVKSQPQYAFILPVWLLKGKAAFKREIAHHISFDPSLIPYRSKLIEFLKIRRAQGRSIVLATAGDEGIAQRVADYLGIFDAVLASDGQINLAGEHKRECLVSRFGEKGFDYIANGNRDLAVWSSAREAIVVTDSDRFAKSVEKVAHVQKVFESDHGRIADYWNALRPQHWLKNLLLFVPLLGAHRVHDPLLWERNILAYVAFCLCASSGYLFNDLLDLSADRHHPLKRLRPFAAGRLPLSYGLVMIPLLVLLGCAIALMLPRLFAEILLLYFALTLTYSLVIKKIALLDVIVLAGLYTLRIMAGSAAVGIWPSEWLLAFSTFLFLSLAFVKRYSELVIMRRVDGDQARARGYQMSDAELLASKGTASGYMAVLVLALYINSATARALYGRHDIMWFLCPLLLYWIGNIWLVAHRGEMHDDPLVFTLHDRTSRILMVLMLITVLFAL